MRLAHLIAVVLLVPLGCEVRVTAIACESDAHCPAGQECGDDRSCRPWAGPVAPVVRATTPASPGRARQPLVAGTAPANALVELFAGAVRVASGHASSDGTFELALTAPLAANAASTLTAIATDAKARRSARSEGLVYVHDDVPPDGGVVLDGAAPGDDVDGQASLTRLEGHWSGFRDSNGVIGYEHSVSSTGNCPGTVRAPTSAGAASSIVATELSLVNGTTYQQCVRASDRAGNVGPWVASDGVRTDLCLESNGGCDPRATCSSEPGSVRCVCGAGDFGDGYACQKGAIVGAAAELATLPGGTCWFSELVRAAVTTPGGTHHVVAGLHRTCSTNVDDLVDITSSDALSWSRNTIGTYDYSAHPPGEAWGRGLPGTIAAALDGTGRVHVVARLQAGQGYISPAQGWYLFENGAGWTDAGLVVSDEPVQVAQGNSAGADSSGFSHTLAFDAANGLLRLFACDGAWYATRWNALASAAAPGAPSWPPFEVVETMPGPRVDRATIMAIDQDFDRGRGVQVWIHKPSCSLRGRELSGAAFGSVEIDRPLDVPLCTGVAEDNFGFMAETQVLWRGDELHAFVFLWRPSRELGDRVLVWLTRDGAGTWQRRTFPWDGNTHQRAFVAAGGELAILRANRPSGRFEVHFPERAATQPVYEYSGSIAQLDLARREPKFVAWVETNGTGSVLKAAPLMLAR